MSNYFQSYVDPPKDSNGYLTLHVKNKQGEDLKDAKVEIVRRRDSVLMKELITNENGEIKASLQTPPAGYGIKGEQYVVPYTSYTLRINYKGKIVVMRNVSVYANLTTIQYCVI